MNKTGILILGTIGFLGVLSCSSRSVADNAGANLVQRGKLTLDSLYSHYGIEGEYLLRENYPVDESFKAGYLASDDGTQGNPYSYLWPYSGTLSAVRALYDASADTSYLTLLDSHVIPGLEQYLDTLRQPVAYASYVNTSRPSDRFYDDNVWLGIDFADLYLSTHRSDYLDKSKNIWRFVQSGMDDTLGGGIYWCEQQKHSKNTCSNAPGSVYALKLFECTNDSAYLEEGTRLYDWTRNALQDTTDCLYFDNINLQGEINKAKFAYNSGQMLQAASILYRLTGNREYLLQAQSIARSAADYFFKGGEAEDAAGVFPLLSKGNIWFTAVMMRGFNELYRIDGDDRYMESFVRNLDHAWTAMRDESTGLFNEDWSGEERQDKKWLLTQGAMVEMLATAAEYLNTKNNK